MTALFAAANNNPRMHDVYPSTTPNGSLPAATR